MSEFTCKNDHIMSASERAANRCAVCGEPMQYMDGMTAKQLAEIVRFEIIGAEIEPEEMEDES